MSMQIILAGLGIFALLGAYVMFKLKHAHREIEQLLKTNAQLQTQTACSNQAISVINPSCSGFGIITASRQDTTETLRQIAIHNATYREICTKSKESK